MNNTDTKTATTKQFAKITQLVDDESLSLTDPKLGRMNTIQFALGEQSFEEFREGYWDTLSDPRQYKIEAIGEPEFTPHAAVVKDLLSGSGKVLPVTIMHREFDTPQNQQEWVDSIYGVPSESELRLESVELWIVDVAILHASQWVAGLGTRTRQASRWIVMKPDGWTEHGSQFIDWDYHSTHNHFNHAVGAAMSLALEVPLELGREMAWVDEAVAQAEGEGV